MALLQELRAEADDHLTTKEAAERKRYMQEFQDEIKKMTTEIAFVEQEYTGCRDESGKLWEDR